MKTSATIGPSESRATLAYVAAAILIFLAIHPLAAAQSQRKPPLQLPPALPMPAESGRAPVRDIRMWYAIYNKKSEGTPVLLIHGGLAMSEAWGHQVPPLMKQHEIIVADTRGHGRSTRGKQPLAYATMADDFVALLDYLKIDKVALVGHSDGAIIGLDMAMRYPQRLSRLLAFAANYNVAGFKDDGFEPTRDPVFARAAGHWQREYERVSPTPTEYESFREEMFAMWASQPDFKPEQLAAIRTPTLIMGAEQDEFIRREHTEQLARLIPGAKLIMLPRVGHLALAEEPPIFSREVMLFLNAPL